MITPLQLKKAAYLEINPYRNNYVPKKGYGVYQETRALLAGDWRRFLVAS